MRVESQIKKIIEKFTLSALHDVKEVRIYKEDNVLIFIKFQYIDYIGSVKSNYQITFMFLNCHFIGKDNLDISSIFDINRLEFKDISGNSWENIRWLIEDSDDDGVRLMSFYCEEIQLCIVSYDDKILYEASI